MPRLKQINQIIDIVFEEKLPWQKDGLRGAGDEEE